MSRLTRSQSQALTRERLMAAARMLFGRDGFAATSLDRIAEEAGYSKGAIYSNFGGKEEMFLAALKAEGDETMGALVAALARTETTQEAIELLAGWADGRATSGRWSLTLLEYARQVQGDADALHAQQGILQAYWEQLGQCVIARFPKAGTDACMVGALLFELAYAPALSHDRPPTPGALVRFVLGNML